MPGESTSTLSFFKVLYLPVLAMVLSSAPGPEPSARPPIPEEEMVNRYLAAHEQQESALRGGAMEVDIDASVPNLQKQGKLHALRNISRLGKITYHALGFSGDNTVKN